MPESTGPVQRDEATVRLAVQLSSWEPAIAGMGEFFFWSIRPLIVAMGAETVYREDKVENSGIVDFCNYYLAGTGAPPPACCLVLPWSRPDRVL